MPSFYKVKYYDAGRDKIERFHITGCSFFCALGQIVNYLNEEVGEDEYEILDIISLNIVNFGHECQQESSVDVEFDIVKCPNCGFENHIPYAMEDFHCIKCKVKIERPEQKDDNGKGEED